MSMFSCDQLIEYGYSRSSSVTSTTSRKSKHAANNPFNRIILLNPGPNYEIEAQDICYYISLVKEENYNWKSSKATRSCEFIFIIGERRL